MDLNKLQDTLITAARRTPPSEQVPYAFEKRIMARLASAPVADYWEQFSHALWRAVAPCVAIMVLLGVWSYLSAPSTPPTADFSQQFENTVFAAADQDSSADTLW